MRSFTSRRVILTTILGLGLTSFLWYSGQSSAVVADEASSSLVAINAFRGTYVGGFWGNVVGGGPYGGEVRAKVSRAGVVTLVLPGTGSGTVSPTGAYQVGGSLLVAGVSVNVTYTGNFVATQDPMTGAYLAVIGSGTWRTAPGGISANGKWLVRRTLLTP